MWNWRRWRPGVYPHTGWEATCLSSASAQASFLGKWHQWYPQSKSRWARAAVSPVICIICLLVSNRTVRGSKTKHLNKTPKWETSENLLLVDSYFCWENSTRTGWEFSFLIIGRCLDKSLAHEVRDCQSIGPVPMNGGSVFLLGRSQVIPLRCKLLITAVRPESTQPQSTSMCPTSMTTHLSSPETTTVSSSR